MTAPSDPEDSAAAREEERAIVLRLSDILPRVPDELLKPGPHDPALEVRFTVEELAEKIARGRVTVPLERLSSVFPGVFRDKGAFPGETEVPLPLQKLLAQVGLVGRKSAAPHAAGNGNPGEEVERARAEAGRIIEANAARPVPEFVTPPSVHAVRIGKAIQTARQIFGLFGRGNEESPEPVQIQPPSDEKPEKPEEQSPPLVIEITPETPAVQASPPIQPPPEPAAPAQTISLRVLPIYRLLSTAVLGSAEAPDAEARVTLPLAAIEPQLAGGHVEIPLDEFMKALPEGLREGLKPAPDAQVWIPLDEIFQNLPPDHLFYMPPLEPAPEPPALPVEAAPRPAVEPAAVTEPAAPVESAKAPAEKPADEAVPSPSPEPPKEQEVSPVIESTPPPAPVAQDPAPEIAAPPAPAEGASAAPVVEATVEPAPVSTEGTPAGPASEPTPLPPARAPWMRGFQVPPPRLFVAAAAPEAPPAEAPAPVEPPPPPAPTPEAKRTVDFLAGQPGIFAAAAFVEGAVFASADFPRKPDLDALRNFMGVFIESAKESGQRLGWNRVLTIPCEQFHLTSVVRDRHFVVALHHDRLLPPVTYDALVLAADELSNAGE